jgi:hypothetical protein
MRPTPTTDHYTPLKDIISREDYQYKKSLRNNVVSPNFIADVGKNNRGKRANEAIPVQYHVQELHLIKHKMKGENKMLAKLKQTKILAATEDSLTKVARRKGQENTLGAAQERILHENSTHRNRLCELNHLLYKQDMSIGGGNQSALTNRQEFVTPKNVRRNRSAETNKNKKDKSIPFMIGDSSLRDEIVLEGHEDESSKNLETIDYIHEDNHDELSELPKRELILLINQMEEELLDLNKDVKDLTRQLQEPQNGSGLSKGLLEKTKGFLIRNIWNLNEIKAETEEKDKKFSSLVELLRKHDSGLASNIGTKGSQSNEKLGERIKENEAILKLIEETVDRRSGPALEGLKQLETKFGGNKENLIAHLVDEIDGYKQQVGLYGEYFKKLESYDGNLMKQTGPSLLKKGSGYSIEFLLRALEGMNKESEEKEVKLLNLSKEKELVKVDYQNLLKFYEEEKTQSKKDLNGILNLLNSGSSPFNSTTPIETSPAALLNSITEKILLSKRNVEELNSKLGVCGQKESLRINEMEDLRKRLVEQGQGLDRANMELTKAQERAKFLEIEKLSLEDLQTNSFEDLRRRLKQDHKKQLDGLYEELDQARLENDACHKTVFELKEKLKKQNESEACEGQQKDALQWIIQQLSYVIMSSDQKVTFDGKSTTLLKEMFGEEKARMILNYEKIVKMFKIKCKLIEEIYRERVSLN